MLLGVGKQPRATPRSLGKASVEVGIPAQGPGQAVASDHSPAGPAHGRPIRRSIGQLGHAPGCVLGVASREQVPVDTTVHQLG